MMHENDGSNHRIGRVWDNDGSSHEVNLIYDNDGSNHLCYQRQNQLYTGTNPTTRNNGVNTSTISTGNFYANITNGSGAGAQAYLAFTKSASQSWTQIAVTFSASSGTYAMVWAGITTAVPTTSGGVGWWFPERCEAVKKVAWVNGSSISQASTTKTVDISGYANGTYYIVLSAYSGSSTDAAAKTAVTKVILYNG